MSTHSLKLCIHSSCADRADLPDLLNRINTNKDRVPLCFDEHGILPVLIVRETLTQIYRIVKLPAIDEVMVLLEHQPNKRVRSRETELFSTWMKEFEIQVAAERCDFCGSVSTYSADMFLLREYKDEDFGDLIPRPKPRLTLYVRALTCCSSTVCFNLCQGRTIDMMQRIESVHGHSIRVPTKLQECGWCSAKASESVSLHKCARCKLVCFCSRECQRKSWKAGHKRVCTGSAD